MDWSDTGVLLSARRHGETSAVVHVLTRFHGRHAGLVRGGAGRRASSVVQPGNEVQASWRARLPEQLGTFTLELTQPRAARMLDDPLGLAALTAAMEVLDASLPEREPYPAAYARLCEMLDAVEAGAGDWPERYAVWELNLLADLGFGLDSSPTAGHESVVGSARLWAMSVPSADTSKLPLPAILMGAPPLEDAIERTRMLVEALNLTGSFLRRAVVERRVLKARARLIDRLARKNTISGMNRRHE